MRFKEVISQAIVHIIQLGAILWPLVPLKLFEVFVLDAFQGVQICLRNVDVPPQ